MAVKLDKPESTEVLLAATLWRLIPWAIVMFSVGFSAFLFTRFSDKKKGLVACQKQVDKERDARKKAEEVKRAEPVAEGPAPVDDSALAERLKKDLVGPNVELSTLRGAVTLTFYDPSLFEPGQSDLTEQGEEILRRLGEVLRGVKGRMFQVGAHCDDGPSEASLRELYPTAWELSAARAINVVRFLADEGKVSSHLLYAGGYGNTRPLGSNSSAMGKARNRRTEISFVPDAYVMPPDASVPSAEDRPAPRERPEPRDNGPRKRKKRGRR